MASTKPSDDRTLPLELKPGNLKKLGTTGKQPRPQNMQSQAADNARYEPAQPGLQAEAAGTKAHKPRRNKSPSPTQKSR